MIKYNNAMEINNDGTMKNETFSGVKYKGDFPYPNENDTYASYRKRVDEAKEKGFHLGDLSNSNWTYYCMGSGSYDDVNENTKIFNRR
jgi:hypothetical protein